MNSERPDPKGNSTTVNQNSSSETRFSDLGIAEPILRALDAEGYDTPTPIQAKSIPLLLEEHDLLGIAQTGTGKTASFAIPVLQQLAQLPGKPAPHRPRALVLAPTRELALQIAEGFKTYGKFLKLRHAVIFGGVSYGPQIKELERGVDIIVATPGRLMDHMAEGRIKLDQLSCLVLDEADRMLDMGFIRDVTKIVDACPDDRQSLLFSATMAPNVAKLAANILFEPSRVEITPKKVAVDRIEQSLFHIDGKEKSGLLLKLLADEEMKRVIVFTRTKHGANRVAERLEKAGISSAAIHGNKSQGARQRALGAFKSGRLRVLVATDIAARGIDVDGVTHVVNYELPDEPESFVHRIGRTARAGASGIAYAFCDATERGQLRAIERLIKREIPVADGYEKRGPDVAAKKPQRGRRNGKTVFEKPSNSRARHKGPGNAGGAATGGQRGNKPRAKGSGSGSTGGGSSNGVSGTTRNSKGSAQGASASNGHAGRPNGGNQGSRPNGNQGSRPNGDQGSRPNGSAATPGDRPAKRKPSRRNGRAKTTKAA